MKVYLDNSVLNRPFDDQSVPKIRLETTATVLIFGLIEAKKIRLVNSPVIDYENSKNPFFERKIWISAYLSQASFYQGLNQEVKKRAKTIKKMGIAPIDNLHLASAEAACVDYFLTCDYTIVRRYRGILKVLNPADLIQLSKSK